MKKRTVTFSLLYVGILCVFVTFVLFLQSFIQSRFGINFWIMPILALFLMTVFISPLENSLAMLTDRVLYQRRYDYMVTLKNAAKGMALVTDSGKLLSIIVHFISKEIRVSGCAIYIYNASVGNYLKEVSRGFKGVKISDDVAKNTSFVEWLIEKKEPLRYKDVQKWLKGGKFFAHKMVLKRTLEQIRITMNTLGASLCVPSFLRGELVGFLVLGEKLSGHRYSYDDILLLSTLANNAAIALENARMYEELKRRIEKLDKLYQAEHGLFLDTVSAFAYAVDVKDGYYAHGHALNVANYASAITDKLKYRMPYVSFDDNFYDTLKMASLLHDIGKIGVSDKLLKKEGKLTRDEQKQLMQHAEIGEAILRPMAEMGDVFDLIRHHHERYNGGGYPDGLSGNDIPLISRIVSVANVYDTLVSDRPYRKAMSRTDAIAEIKKASGKEFDPVVVKAFLESVQQ
ncbi:MAG: HD domain-containing phosphohydrolase [Candidatus Omnitrophota bacterium]